MSKVRVYEVAKQLNMDQKTLVALFQSMGIGDVRNHMSAVEADVVDRVRRHLERQKTPEVVEERIRPTVVKRRARATEPEPVPSARPSQSGVTPPVAPTPPPAPPSRTAAEDEPPPAQAAPSSRATRKEAKPSEQAVEAKPSARGSSAARAKASAQEAGGTPTSVRDVDFDEAPAISAAPATTPSAPVAPEPSAPAPRPSQANVAPDPAPSVKGTAPKAKPSQKGARVEPETPAPPVEAAPAVARDPEILPPPPPVEPPVAVAPPPSAPPVVAAPPPSAPPPATRSPVPPAPVEAPRRPSTPPRTGIDVWGGRPGVPMPAQRASAPPARRTTYDPRASTTPQRPGQAPMFPSRPGGNRPGGRVPFGQHGRLGKHPPGMQSLRRPVNTPEMAAHKKVIKIEEQVSLQKLAALMSLKVTDVLMKLLGMGMTGVNINSTIDSDTAKILAGEFGWTVEDVAMSEEATLEAAMGLDDKTDYELVPRPPIVTVMGHVDHGKTSLLDRIRKTTVAAGEAGGITQHIGAYRVETPKGTIAFLDTPGHEAFTAMRARGAQVTDIVILVVAADDGVMPQTREAINHAQSAKVPIIVAVNKIDKPSADPDKVKRELANLGLSPEEWGGSTLYCHVSALTGQGIDELLEALVLQAEVLELTAAPKRKAHGVVIEALLDRGRGPVARVMIQDGTLRVGDTVLAGAAWGKVRAMTDELGRALGSAGPATPVEVLGLNDVPSAGDPVHAVKDAKTAEEIAEQRRKKISLSGKQDVGVKLADLMERLREADQLELKLIIKGDVQGSVEAVVASLSKLTTPKVKVTVVHAAVGAITEGDVNLAIASKAIIAGFNVRPAGKASAAAEVGGVEIRLYSIIYNAVDDIRAAMEGLLPTTKVEKALGAASVRLVFKITKIGVVAGCYVTSGVMKRGSDARLVREGAVVYTGKLATLRRVKEDVKEVAENTECGITLDGFQDIKEGDIIEAFEVEEVKQKLA